MWHRCFSTEFQNTIDLYGWHALKGQKLLAQGSALGIIAIGKAPCKGKSFKTPGNNIKLLPLQGDRFASKATQGAALG